MYVDSPYRYSRRQCKVAANLSDKEMKHSKIPQQAGTTCLEVESDNADLRADDDDDIFKTTFCFLAAA